MPVAYTPENAKEVLKGVLDSGFTPYGNKNWKKRYEMQHLPYQSGRGLDPRRYPGDILIGKISISEYEHYLLSDAWANKRREAFKEYGMACMACKKAVNLHVHHATYKRFGKENLGDLRILCGACHDTLHRSFKASQENDLKSFTNKFLRLS